MLNESTAQALETAWFEQMMLSNAKFKDRQMHIFTKNNDYIWQTCLYMYVVNNIAAKLQAFDV